MNVAFFLTPKDQVVWVPAGATLLEALSIMEPHRHSAVPLLDTEGRYQGTLTEGDVLWRLRFAEGDWKAAAAATPVSALARWMRNEAISISAEIETLLARVIAQSYVPVVDDRGVFVGIVRREKVIAYCAKLAGIGQ